MPQRVRNVLDNGRVPYEDPASPRIDDTHDGTLIAQGGLILSDPSVPEDIGSEAVNMQAPAAVAAPTVTTGQATDHVYVNASWTAAAAAENVPPAAQYEVYVNVSGQNPTVIRVAATITSVRIAPAKPSTTYQVKVRPISRLEVAGTYSSYGSVSSAAFVVPTVTFSPTTPSAPTVTAAVYSALVSWTALTDVTSGYGHYDVQIATDAGFTANVRTRAVDGTIMAWGDLAPNTTYYFRVRGVAPDGTAGSWSSGASATTAFIVNGDIAANTITAAKIAADTLTAAEIATDAITANELAAINLAVGKYIKSTSYSAGSSGWAILADGSAEFNNITARGYIEGANIAQVDGGDLLNNGGGIGQDYDGDLSTQNLVSNYGFETNTTGWAALANCTIARVTSAAKRHSGAGALETTGTNTTQASVTTDRTNGNRIAVTAGRTYAATCWVRTNATARSTAIKITWWDSSNSVISTSTGTRANDSTTYGIRGVSATAPANAVTCTIEVEFGTTGGAVGELHELDDVALWDYTTFSGLGWSITGTGITPYLAVETLNSAQVNSIYIEPTDLSDTWYLETPSITPTANRAYRASFDVKPLSAAAEPYCSEVQLVFNKAGTPENDGALYSPRASTNQYTTYDNFSSGGNGNAESVTPTTLNARFGRPNSLVAIALAGACLIRNFTLKRSGQVTGHLTPVGAITGLLGGTYAFNASVGSTTPGTETSVMPSAAAEAFGATVVAYSEPSGYFDTSRNNIIMLWFSCSAFNLDAASTDTIFKLYISLDGGTTYTTLCTSRARNGSAASGSVRDMHALSGTFWIPAGIDPKIDIKMQHTLVATASNEESGRLSWLIIPA